MIRKKFHAEPIPRDLGRARPHARHAQEPSQRCVEAELRIELRLPDETVRVAR